MLSGCDGRSAHDVAVRLAFGRHFLGIGSRGIPGVPPHRMALCAVEAFHQVGQGQTRGGQSPVIRTKSGEQEEPLGRQASTSVGLLDLSIGVVGVLSLSGGGTQAANGLDPLAPEDIPGPSTPRSDKALAPEGVGTVHVQCGDHGVFGAQPIAVLRPGVSEQAFPDGPCPPLADGRVQPPSQLRQGAGGVKSTMAVPWGIREKLLHPAGHPEDSRKQIGLFVLGRRGGGVQTAGPVQESIGRKSHTGPFALHSVMHPYPVRRAMRLGIVLPPPWETQCGRQDPVKGRLVPGRPMGSMNHHGGRGGKPNRLHLTKRMRPSTSRTAA